MSASERNLSALTPQDAVFICFIRICLKENMEKSTSFFFGGLFSIQKVKTRIFIPPPSQQGLTLQNANPPRSGTPKLPPTFTMMNLHLQGTLHLALEDHSQSLELPLPVTLTSEQSEKLKAKWSEKTQTLKVRVSLSGVLRGMDCYVGCCWMCFWIRIVSYGFCMFLLRLFDQLFDQLLRVVVGDVVMVIFWYLLVLWEEIGQWK